MRYYRRISANSGIGMGIGEAFIGFMLFGVVLLAFIAVAGTFLVIAASIFFGYWLQQRNVPWMWEVELHLYENYPYGERRMRRPVGEFTKREGLDECIAVAKRYPDSWRIYRRRGKREVLVKEIIGGDWDQ
jgi:hypothetical protein